MALAPDLSTSAASDLQTVSIVCISDSLVTQLWIDALKHNNAEMLDDEQVNSLQDITRQKLAVILDQDMPEDNIIEIIEKYEKICQQNPGMSLRFFCLKWNKEISNDNDRFRMIDIMDMSPNNLPARINRALFKARLPIFLRKHYEVEIADTLEEINGIHYRPITIRRYEKIESRNNLLYVTEGLFIHDKCLFLLTTTDGRSVMTQITERDKVFIKKFDSKIPPSLTDLAMLKNESEEE